MGPADAEDIVNETFAIAYVKRESFDRGQDDAGPWLFGIATNLIRRQARREARDLNAYARTGVDPVAPDPTERRVGIAREVAAALAALSAKQRDVLFLHAIADFSHEQIAEALGISVGTARARFHRARTAAAKELTARGVAPSETLEPDLKVAES